MWLCKFFCVACMRALHVAGRRKDDLGRKETGIGCKYLRLVACEHRMGWGGIGLWIIVRVGW